jgi:hypothetical protein
VIFDQGRRILSFRDSVGGVIREASVPRGFFNGIIAVPEHRRIILAGRLAGGPPAGTLDLHELDYAGRRIRSFRAAPPSGSLWQAKFAAMWMARVNDNVVTGSLNSRRLRLYNLRTRDERTIDITGGAGWLAPLAWPSDALLERGTTSQTTAERITAWMRTQRLFNAAFPLGEGRILVRAQAYDLEQHPFFYYVVVDTAGRTVAISQATRNQVVSTVADTVFWITTQERAVPRLGSGILRAR